MNGDFISLLTRRDTLLALGVCLVIVGVVLRGIARSGRRDQARRKQQRLAPRADLSEPDPVDQHLETNLPRYAAGCLIAGLVLCVAAFLR
jgi:hypothetical protein